MLAFLDAQAAVLRPASLERALRERFHLFNRCGSPDLRAAEIRHLQQDRRLAEVFIFHGDGRVRAAALAALIDPVRAPATLAGILWRLNDWAPEVQQIARRALDRCLDHSPPAVLVPEIWTALIHGHSWRRWAGDYDRFVLQIARHPDVVAALATRLTTRTQGRCMAVFQGLCRDPSIDPFLGQIAHGAGQPHVRAAALNVLIAGRAAWPRTTMTKLWIDKPLGRYRLAPEFDSRAITVPVAVTDVLSQALHSRSAPVRRVVIEALIQRRRDPQYQRLIAQCLRAHAGDRRASVRNRLDFLARNWPGHPGATAHGTP